MKSPRRRGGHNKGPKGKAQNFSEIQVLQIAEGLTKQQNLKELALFTTGLDTLLRASDLLALRVCDVMTRRGQIRDRFIVIQQKTQHPVKVNLKAYTRHLLLQLITESGKQYHDYLFTTRTNRPITAEWFRILVKRWAEMIGLDPTDFSGHSLRRTQAIFLYNNRFEIAKISKALGHQSLLATIEYLGLEDDEVLTSLERRKLSPEPSLLNTLKRFYYSLTTHLWKRKRTDIWPHWKSGYKTDWKK